MKIEMMVNKMSKQVKKQTKSKGKKQTKNTVKKSIKKQGDSQSKKDSSLRLVVLLVIIAFLCVGITAMIYGSFIVKKPFEVQVLPYDFVVKNTVAFNLDTDIMHFGGSAPGRLLQRSLNLTSPKDALVHVDWSGDGVLVVDDNDFYLQESESKEIMFSLYIPSEIALGNYSGEIVFSFYDS